MINIFILKNIFYYFLLKKMGLSYDKINYPPRKIIKQSRKNSALENIQKNSVDYSKENKTIFNNQPRYRISKLKITEKEEELYQKGEEDLSKRKTDESDQTINDNMKMIFSNLNISNKENTTFNSCNSEEENSEDYEYFLQRAEKIRYSYIQKLVSKAYYLPKNNPRNRYNSLIIFDWDDTLFPTSFLARNGYFENINSVEKEDKILKKLEKLEKSVIELINISLNKGEVYIITNAALGWVEYTANKFYPKFSKILDKITVISARGEWEGTFPDDIKIWKMQAFSNLRNYFDNKLVTNIICLGDSMLEIEAGKFLANCFKEAFIKTVKFKENPKPEELNKQLILVIKQFNLIHSSIKSLTIKVERRKVSENK